MKQTDTFHQVAAFASHEWHSAATAVPAFLHSVADFMRSAPSNMWAMCAFAAAGSIMVTLVTLCLWPNAVDVAPEREATDASGVCRMARHGSSVAEIARRTGLSHDAVATILRASKLPRGERTAPTRKTRPTAA
jgi:hypothetical protein